MADRTMFQLKESLRGQSDEVMLGELRRAANEIGRGTITIAEFVTVGRTHPSTIQRRFGSWSRALALAGLAESRSKIGISEDELFENMKSVWLRLGRQPRYTEMTRPDSRYSAGTYENRFGTWRQALEQFVKWTNISEAI